MNKYGGGEPRQVGIDAHEIVVQAFTIGERGPAEFCCERQQ